MPKARKKYSNKTVSSETQERTKESRYSLLKLVGGITAVLSLIFGLQQITLLVSNFRERQRQVEELHGPDRGLVGVGGVGDRDHGGQGDGLPVGHRGAGRQIGAGGHASRAELAKGCNAAGGVPAPRRAGAPNKGDQGRFLSRTP